MDTLDIRLSIVHRLNERIDDLDKEDDDIEQQIDHLRHRQGDIWDERDHLCDRLSAIHDVSDAEVERVFSQIETVEPTPEMAEAAALTKSCRTWDDWRIVNAWYETLAAGAKDEQAAAALERMIAR